VTKQYTETTYAEPSDPLLVAQKLDAPQRRRGVVGSTLAFGSIGHVFESEHRLFSQQAEITGEVLTGRFSSSTAVVHSASYPPGRANRVAAYQW